MMGINVVVDRKITFEQKMILRWEREMQRICKNAGVDYIPLLGEKVEENQINKKEVI